MQSNQINLVPPDLTSYMDQRKFEFKSEMNCIGIGTIVAFNSIQQTVDVSLNYLRVIYGGQVVQGQSSNDATFAQDKVIPPTGTTGECMPVLVRCPLMILQGGGASITFPITAGDTCVILFNDRDMDNWWTTGNVVAPNTTRLHDLTDAIVFVGVNSLKKAITNYFNGFKINYGNASITIDPSGNIVITGTTINLV